MKKLNLTKTQKTNGLTYLIVIVFYIAMTAWKASGTMKSSLYGMLVPICAYVVLALSLNLTVGIMGELSLGHAGFMAIGAFFGTSVTMGLINTVTNANLRMIIGILVGALAGALFGFLIGIPVLRLNGDYLAIVTLGFGEIIRNLVSNFYLGIKDGKIVVSMLNNNLDLGENDTIIIEGPMGIRNIPRIANFTIGTILVLVCLVIIFHMINSRTGRAVMALRDNRIAAESVGIPVFKYKITAFTISAAMAGAAGALYGNNYSSLMSSKFNIDTSILILVFVVLGGLGNMMGSIIAATALTILPELLRAFADYRMLTYAIVLILVMLVSNNPVIKNWVEELREKIVDKLKIKKKDAEGGAN